jgi:hypothetical protein
MPVLLEVPGPEGKGPDRGQIEIAKRLREEARRPKKARASQRPKKARARK